MPAFTEKITQAMPHMTRAQKKVALYYLENGSQAAFSTLEDTARQIDVSTTTVIRFARTLGYAGFSEMQGDCREALLQKVDLPRRLQSLQREDNSRQSLLLDSMQSDIANITDTFAMQCADTLAGLTRQICEARTVYVLGLRSSFALAHYLTSRLAQIRPHVRLIQTGGMLYPEDFGGCGHEDLCIAFLFPRYSKTTANLLTWIREQGVPVALFTSDQPEDVSHLADTLIPCRVTGVSYKNSFAAPLALCNFLAASVAISGNDQAMESIRRTESFLERGYYLGL